MKGSKKFDSLASIEQKPYSLLTTDDKRYNTIINTHNGLKTSLMSQMKPTTKITQQVSHSDLIEKSKDFQTSKS